MKTEKNKTHEATLKEIALGFIIMIFLFIAFYSKWYLCDREKEIQNKQLQEMVDYHQFQGREILVFEE